MPPSTHSDPGQPVTAIVTGYIDAQYARAGTGPDIPMAVLVLPGGQRAYVPGHLLIPGDALPIVRQALEDAKQFRDCGTDPECQEWICQYERLLDALVRDEAVTL